MKNFKILLIAAIFGAICFSLHTPEVFAENIIYPGDPRWSLETLGDGNAEITGENPRSGNGSLALTTDTLDDWAFYRRYAGDDITSSSWGLLSDINGLSFDWYREDLGMTDMYPDNDPWVVQTPALRLFVRDYYTVDGKTNTFYSELVWEKYYTESSPYMNDEWVHHDLLGDNFWRHIFDEGYTISDGTNLPDFGTHTLWADPTSSWASLSTAVALPYSENAVVYGLSVGAGSFWPEENKAYVDNIFLAFGDNRTVIEDNFELPVPEPATFLLLGSGLITLAVRRKRKFKR